MYSYGVNIGLLVVEPGRDSADCDCQLHAFLSDYVLFTNGEQKRAATENGGRGVNILIKNGNDRLNNPCQLTFVM